MAKKRFRKVRRQVRGIVEWQMYTMGKLHTYIGDFNHWLWKKMMLVSAIVAAWLSKDDD